MSYDAVFAHIQSALDKAAFDRRSVVVATCGIAGSGKSTLAKAIVSKWPNFTRLSIDEIVNETHGMFGIDYPADDGLYIQYLDEADLILQTRFETLLNNSQHIVLDRWFWAKQDREIHKSKAEAHQATWILVFLKAEKDFLWHRITSRRQKQRDANSAYDITPETFETYWAGFEAPENEDAIVLEVSGFLS